MPQGLLDHIARSKNNLTGEVRHHTTEERFLPPSIKVSAITKRWLQSMDHVESSMYVVRGPNNIPSELYGVSGSNQSIVPTGGLTAFGGEITYIVIDEYDTVHVCPVILQYGDVEMTHQYRLYAVDEFGNYSYVQRFVMKSATSDVVNNDMIVCNFTWTIPNHVANASIGSMTPSWTITSTHTDAYLQVLSVNNMSIGTTVGINSGESMTFRIGERGTTIGSTVSFVYRLYTAEGNVSQRYTAEIPLIFNTPPLLDGFTSNLPTSVLVGQVVPWIWGGGLDINGDHMKLDVLSISHAGMDYMYDLMPGVVSPLMVSGNVGDTIVMAIRLKDRFGVSVTKRLTSTITANPPDISNMLVLYNDEPIVEQVYAYPCDAVTLEYKDIVDITGRDITISVSSPTPNVTFSTSVMSPGTQTVMTFPCGINADDQHEINAVVSNGVASVTRTDLVTINHITGHELINYSRIFIKPSGVTSLTVIGRGGIGEHTTLSGLIDFTFNGAEATATEYPEEFTITFDDLTGDSAAIVVTLATNTVLNFHFS